MKSPLLIVNIVLAVAVAVLFFLHFKYHSTLTKISEKVNIADTSKSKDLKIAYVDLDSIQIHYNYYKEKTTEFEKRKEAVDRDLNSAYQKIENERISFLQKGNNISQIEAENFQREYTRKMQNLEGQKRALENQMQEEGIKTMEELKKKINDFLTDYNKTRDYSYIFSYSSTISVLFYKDTTYNITREVIDGLNEAHKKGKDKK